MLAQITASWHPVQRPLIHVVESDDWHLEQQEDVLWFAVLRKLDWRLFRPVAAQYYEALWVFNQAQAAARLEKAATEGVASPNPESLAAATSRLLFERATMCEDAAVLVEWPVTTSGVQAPRTAPESVAPGVVPARLVGRAPKCFFAMLNAFLAVAIRGRAPEPEVVFEELQGNPSFARACGFTLADKKLGYRQSDVPSLRKLEQFDQIMAANQLWDQAALGRVAQNLKDGIIRAEDTVVHDTTHFHAYSSMQTIEIEPQQAANAEKQAAQPRSPESGEATSATTQAAEMSEVNGTEKQVETAQRAAEPKARGGAKKKDKRKRKSQAKTTKNCRCKERDRCPHPWVSADSGAGTVVKSGGKMYWAHKASTLSFAGQEVLLDAVAVSDAASHDSRSLEPHLERLFGRHPEMRGIIRRVLDDGAADDRELKERVRKHLSIQLLTPINPRGRKAITADLPRGIDHIRTSGTPVCSKGLPFDFLGVRHAAKQFLFRAPLNADGTSVCEGCPLKPACCRNGAERRNIAIPFARLPWLDPQLPQLSQRFSNIMSRRTVIERLHKLMKFDYGDDALTKRGSAAFQARLDKTLLAMHVVLAHA